MSSPGTLTSKECASLLTDVAEWIANTRNASCCDWLQVSRNETTGEPLARVKLATHNDLVSLANEDQQRLPSGDLFIQYSYYARSPDPLRPHAEDAMLAMAATARNLPLPIFQVIGSFLDSTMSNTPSLTIESKYNGTEAEQRRLLGFLAWRSYTISSLWNPVVSVTVDRQGVPLPYRVALILDSDAGLGRHAY